MTHPPTTRQQQQLSLSPSHFPFSHEILLQIFQHLRHADLVSLSLVDRTFRELMRPYIFHHVHLDWEFILRKYPRLLQRGRKRSYAALVSEGGQDMYDDDDSVKRFVEKLSIVDADIQNEWNFKFDQMVCDFQNLRHMTLTTQGSSNFLKYNGSMPQLESLELITPTSDDEAAIFNLNHCRPFTSLKTLTLVGFLLDFDEEDLEGLDIHVKKLDLINCSWNYPFQLSAFGKDITSMSLTYHNHQFILSERFREFLHNPELPQLRYLTISNQNHLKLHITFKIMNFLRNIPSLQRLYLLGNIYNETINNFTTHDLENKMRYILNVNDVKIFYSSFVDC